MAGSTIGKDASLDQSGLDQPRDEARAGEVASPGALAADATLCFIGRIETPWRTRSDCPRQGDALTGPPCRLLVDARWIPALEGVEQLDALQVLYWMFEARRDLVRLAPRHATPRGPFALRAPTRPNPIASSIVSLVERQGAALIVRGLDCIDGTPLLDIKSWRGSPA